MFVFRYTVKFIHYKRASGVEWPDELHTTKVCSQNNLPTPLRDFFRNFAKEGGAKQTFAYFMGGGQECFEKIFTH